MTPAETAFYAWWHEHGKPDFLPAQRAAFVAGWDAGQPEPEPEGPPEYDPDDAEAQRIADVFADARAEQDRGL